MDEPLSQDEIDALLNARSSADASGPEDVGDAPQPFLSQNEIASLLSTVASSHGTGDADMVTMISNTGTELARIKDVVVEKYDFSIPSRVSRDHLRSLQALHDGYAQTLSSAFSMTLRAIVEVNCIHIEQLSYGEYLSSLLDPSCIGVFSMSPLKGVSTIEINPLLVFPIIDRLLGGAGAALFYNRAFTTIEGMIIRQVMESALEILEVAWQRNMTLRIKLERMESDPQFIHAAALNDPVILILFDFMMGDIHSMMSLCFPFLTIQQALADLRNEEFRAVLDDDTIESSKEMIYSHMLDLDLTVSVRHEDSRVTLGDLLELQVGDIIRLPETSEDRTTIYIEGQKKFSGKPGMVNGRRAVRIGRGEVKSNIGKTLVTEVND